MQATCILDRSFIQGQHASDYIWGDIMQVFIAIQNGPKTNIDIVGIKSNFEANAYFVVDGAYNVESMTVAPQNENHGYLGVQEVLTFIIANADVVIAIIGALIPLLDAFREPVLEVSIEADGKTYKFVGTQAQVESFVQKLGLDKAGVISRVTMVASDASA